MAHDIANALLPPLNYPERVKKIEENLSYGFVCLKHIHQALTDREKMIVEQIQDDGSGKKLVPALAEVYRLGEKNLELYRAETEKLSRQLEKVNRLVGNYRSSMTTELTNKNSNR